MSTQIRGQTTPIEIKANLLSPHDASTTLVLDWLTGYDYQNRHHELCRVRTPHTGAWFYESEEFKAWALGASRPGSKVRPSNVLWCHGVPGCGKSVLMATAVDHFLSQAEVNPSLGVAYFYFDYKTKSTSRDVISSLLKQLCLLRRSVPRTLQQIYERYRDDHISTSFETLKARKGPETGEIFAALLDVASEFDKAYICIDGLDECAPEYRGSVFEILRRLMKSRCRLLVTSRYEEKFDSLFQGKPRKHLEAAFNDVKAYVSLVLSNHPEFRDMVDSGFEDEIAINLSEKAKGLFLFVYLSMQGLLEQTSVSELRMALAEMPTTLQDVYNGILQRIRDQSSSKSRLAMRIFMWLSFCERSLTVSELQQALAVDPVLDADDLDRERIPPARFFEDVCMDLVTIDKDRSHVLLAHASLSQYLTELKESLFPRGPRDIAYSALTYLHYNEFAMGPCDDAESFKVRLQRFSLSPYVARFWGDHVRGYWLGRIPKGIMTFLSSHVRRDAFVQLMYATESHGGESFRDYPSNMTGLHLAAYFGIEVAASLILGSDEEPPAATSRDSWGRTPLHSACERCLSLTIVEKLLEHGTPVDALDRNGRAAVHLASQVGNVDIVVKLLSTGADPARPDHADKSAFDYAAAESHPKVITELLRQSPSGIFDDGNALVAAATAGHGEIVELLLDYGIDHQKVEALLKAADLGFEEIVKILLESGTDLNSVDEDTNKSALHYAAAAGRTSMVKLLLANGSNVTSRDLQGRTALFLAAERGDEATLKILTEYGAEIEARNDEGKTALFSCAEKGNAAGVDFLLRRGATVSSWTSSSDSTISSEVQETPLQVAARNGHEAVVRLLLEKNPDFQGSTERSTLSYAVENGRIGVVQLLLEAGFNVDLRDEHHDHRTPLSYAVEKGQIEVASLLIRNGARVNATMHHRRTPLFYAVRGGHVEAVRLLLEHEADVNWLDENNVSPLTYAVQHNSPVVRVLLDKGADPTLPDGEGRNAAYYALENQNDEMHALLKRRTSIQRSSTFDIRPDSNSLLPPLTNPSASSKEFVRSKSESRVHRGTSPFDSSNIYNTPSVFKAPSTGKVTESVPGRHTQPEQIVAVVRQLFPSIDNVDMRLVNDCWSIELPRRLTVDEKQHLVEMSQTNRDK
ncbi:ankyrin [Lophiostoma macrostomum CBS 122681]|uniref:Ankyrin n=1 Tax=Lophiostoma macrostomum CBS 122681 TaxID=1314788 RepID=A0A6A6T6H2_9PLEO|nr:ankyrin [Lophiostoma macrostomum CBS 122681]